MNLCANIRTIVEANLSEILKLRRTGQMKADESMVTGADLLIQKLIGNYLAEQHSETILVGEEMDLVGFVYDPAKSYVVCDPLDGTENFVSGLKEWGVGVSVFENDCHTESLILLPELGEFLATGQKIESFSSRIHGLSSSLKRQDLECIEEGFEYRIMGCAMYNLFNVIRGSYRLFENVKGVNAWDVLPGINLALEHGCQVIVNGGVYHGEFLPPNTKYRIKVRHR